MPDVEPVIPIGDQGTPAQMMVIADAIRDLSARFRQVSPECAFSVLVSFIVTACVSQDYPTETLDQLVDCVREGIAEVENHPAMGTS
jgi:hypothetical protein